MYISWWVYFVTSQNKDRYRKKELSFLLFLLYYCLRNNVLDFEWNPQLQYSMEQKWRDAYHQREWHIISSRFNQLFLLYTSKYHKVASINVCL